MKQIKTEQKTSLVFWKCGGGSLSYKYGFGFWTGKDEDLLCIYPNTKNNKKAEKYLSSICSNKFFAVISFFLKKMIKRSI